MACTHRFSIVPILFALAAPAAAQCPIETIDETTAGAAVSGDRALVSYFNDSMQFYEHGANGWEPGQVFAAASQILRPLPAAMRGDVAIAGLPEWSGAGMFAQGRAIVFERSGAQWTPTEIGASNLYEDNFFGSAVAIDGEVAVVGAIHAFPEMLLGDYLSRAYVFEKVGGTWTEVAELMPSPTGDYFGEALALDGDTLVAGAIHDNVAPAVRAGAVYVYERIGGTWQQTAKLRAQLPEHWQAFGDSVALEGDTLVVGATYDFAGEPGFIDVFERQGGRLAAGPAPARERRVSRRPVRGERRALRRDAARRCVGQVQHERHSGGGLPLRARA